MTASTATLPATKHKRVPLWLLGAFLATGFGTVLGLTLEQPLIAAIVPLVAAGAWAFFQVPLKISASALFLSAFFFEGLADPSVANSNLSAPAAEQFVHDFLMTAEGLELAGLFPRLRRGPLRRRILDLVRAIVEDDPAGDDSID